MSKGMLPVIGLAVVVTASLPLATNAGWGKRKPCPPEYPSYFPVTPSPQASPEPGQPQTGPEASEPSEPSAVSFDDAFGAAGSSLETAGGPMSSTPFMLGDSFGLSGNFFLGYISSVDGGTQVSANSSTPIAGGRRFKIAESTSPLPRDRVFLTYNLFRDAYQTQSLAGGVPPIGRDRAGIGGPSPGGFPPGGPGVGSRSFDVHRFTFGLEKTFFNGMTSAEVRLPFSRTLGGNLVISPNTIPGDEDVLLDNMSLAFKSLLYTGQSHLISLQSKDNPLEVVRIPARELSPDA